MKAFIDWSSERRTASAISEDHLGASSYFRAILMIHLRQSAQLMPFGSSRAPTMCKNPMKKHLLLRRLKAVTTNALSTGQLWLPGAAEPLARHQWSSLREHLGLSPETYGTDRIR